MLPKTVIYYGSRQAVPEPIALTAGPLTMRFEPLTGLLRYIRIGDHEIVRALYLDRLRSDDPHLPDAALPRIDDERHNGRPYRWVYGVGGQDAGDFPNRIVKVDTERRASVWQYWQLSSMSPACRRCSLPRRRCSSPPTIGSFRTIATGRCVCLSA